MAFRRRSSSSWTTPNRIRRRSGSSWVDVQTIRRRSGSSWITVYTAYTAPSGSITGTSANILDPTNPFPPATMTVTAYPTANVSGGTGNYTYSWSVTSGYASISGSTTGKSCQLSANVPNHGVVSGNIRCVVSDGVSSITLNASYSLHYSGGIPV